MMLTAKDTELDTVRALDNGADDYLAKPFGMMEMVSGARAPAPRGPLHHGREERGALAGAAHALAKAPRGDARGVELSLTQREFDLLEFLMRSPGEVFSREELLQRVWGWDFDGGSRTVDVHVQQLRAKLGKHSDLIETVRGVGYRARG